MKSSKYKVEIMIYILISLFFFTSALSELDNATPKLKDIIQKIVSFRSDGKIYIPDHVKHVKLDIGLSYSAPISQYWLTHEDSLIVFGFEPNPASVASILHGAIKQLESHGDPLSKEFIGQKFFIIPTALGQHSNSSITFYVTENDPGTSSLYLPLYLPIKEIIQVPVFTLRDFFEIFPFDTHPVIEYIKIDAQGSDLDIAKGAGNYLQERIVYITLEAENYHYENTVNSAEEIDNFMRNLGFIQHFSSDVSDPTYFNLRFSDYIKNHEVKIYQHG